MTNSADACDSTPALQQLRGSKSQSQKGHRQPIDLRENGNSRCTELRAAPTRPRPLGKSAEGEATHPVEPGQNTGPQVPDHTHSRPRTPAHHLLWDAIRIPVWCKARQFQLFWLALTRCQPGGPNFFAPSYRLSPVTCRLSWVQLFDGRPQLPTFGVLDTPSPGYSTCSTCFRGTIRCRNPTQRCDCDFTRPRVPAPAAI